MQSPPIEPFADAYVDPPDSPSDDVRLSALAVDIVLHPRSAMRRLAAHPGRRWLWPMVVLAAAALASTAASLPARRAFDSAVTQAEIQSQFEKSPEAFGGQTPDDVLQMTSSTPFAAVGMGFSLFGTILSVVVGIAVAAALFHALGTVLGGQQSFTQMLTIVSWAHVPFVFRDLLQFMRHATGGFDPNPSGLSGLVACVPGDASCVQSYWGPLLARVELWNVWYWFLLVVGVGVVCHVSRRKALVAVAVLVLLQVALGLVGVLTTRQLTGMFG